MESPPQGELRATLPGPRPAELLRGTRRAEQVATQSRPWGVRRLERGREIGL